MDFAVLEYLANIVIFLAAIRCPSLIGSRLKWMSELSKMAFSFSAWVSSHVFIAFLFGYGFVLFGDLGQGSTPEIWLSSKAVALVLFSLFVLAVSMMMDKWFSREKPNDSELED